MVRNTAAGSAEPAEGIGPVNRAANELGGRDEGSCNPYESSLLSDSSLPTAAHSAAPSFARWRIYLLVHLSMVILMAAMYLILDSPWGSASRSPAAMQAIGPAINLLGMLLILHNSYMSPILVIVLFTMAAYRDRRYALAGLVELLLTIAFFFVCLPMVQ
jgi:hypothetical protein